jgi:hypothetical protein
MKGQEFCPISAKTYAKSLNMSTREIYDQLISEYGGRFTPSEAQYAKINERAGILPN